MIRSSCAALFSVVVATVLVTSPQSSEAKDRRCHQPRCCPQTVCAQPQPACCQPRGTCCQPRPSCCHQNKSAGFLDVEVPYYCAYFQYGESGGVYYYYAPHCLENPYGYGPTSFPSAVSDPSPGDQCGNDPPNNSTWCMHDPSRFRLDRRGFKGGAKGKLKPGTPLKSAASEHHHKIEVVGLNGNTNPYYVWFNVAGITKPIVAQVWQWDVRPKNANPKYPPARFSIGQQVDKKETAPDVHNIAGDPVQVGDFVYDVRVSHLDPAKPGTTYEITYRVVIAENQEIVLKSPEEK